MTETEFLFKGLPYEEELLNLMNIAKIYHDMPPDSQLIVWERFGEAIVLVKPTEEYTQEKYDGKYHGNHNMQIMQFEKSTLQKDKHFPKEKEDFLERNIEVPQFHQEANRDTLTIEQSKENVASFIKMVGNIAVGYNAIKAAEEFTNETGIETLGTRSVKMFAVIVLMSIFEQDYNVNLKKKTNYKRPSSYFIGNLFSIILRYFENTNINSILSSLERNVPPANQFTIFDKRFNECFYEVDEETGNIIPESVNPDAYIEHLAKVRHKVGFMTMSNMMQKITDFWYSTNTAFWSAIRLRGMENTYTVYAKTTEDGQLRGKLGKDKLAQKITKEMCDTYYSTTNSLLRMSKTEKPFRITKKHVKWILCLDTEKEVDIITQPGKYRVNVQLSNKIIPRNFEITVEKTPTGVKQSKFLAWH